MTTEKLKFGNDGGPPPVGRAAPPLTPDGFSHIRSMCEGGTRIWVATEVTASLSFSGLMGGLCMTSEQRHKVQLGVIKIDSLWAVVN